MTRLKTTAPARRPRARQAATNQPMPAIAPPTAASGRLELPRHRIESLRVEPPRPVGRESRAAAPPIQLMSKRKRQLLKAAKWTGGAAAAMGALLLGGAALGVGGLAAGAAWLGGGLMAGGVLGGLGAHAAEKAATDPAEARMARWVQRDQARNERGRFETGTYAHNAGPVGISGLNRQRISQTNRDNYGGASLGPMPDYADVRRNLNYPGAHRAIYDPSFTPPPGLTGEQRIATGLSASLSNASEGDRIPGIPKFIRATARRYDANPTLEHPLNATINPAVARGGAAPSRDFMSGRTPLTAAQRDAVDRYASDSSDDEEERFVTRTGMLRKTQ